MREHVTQISKKLVVIFSYLAIYWPLDTLNSIATRSNNFIYIYIYIYTCIYIYIYILTIYIYLYYIYTYIYIYMYIIYIIFFYEGNPWLKLVE